MNVTTLPLDTLKIDPQPLRQYDARAIETIRRSLAVFGQLRPLLVQARTHRLIAGEATVNAMRRLGWTDAACLVLDVDDRHAELLAILDHRVDDLSHWDEDELGSRLVELRYADGTDDLDLCGFTAAELHILMDTSYHLKDYDAGHVPTDALPLHHTGDPAQ